MKLSASSPAGGIPSRSLCTQREFLVLCAVLFLALLKIRTSLWQFPSGDTRAYFLPWLAYVQSHGHWHALKQPIGDYFPIYLYMLAAASYLGRFLVPLGEIKLIPLVFDVYTAILAYRTVELLERERGRDGSTSLRPAVALLATFALPSLLLDGALWGQCDSFYVSLLLATVYYTLRRAPARAALCFGLAFCFKLQALFLGPFLLAALLRGRFRWWHVLLVPAVWIASVVPIVLAGRPIGSVFYLFTLQSREWRTLGLNVANPWQWYPHLHLPYTLGLDAGLVITVIAAAGLTWIGYTRQKLNSSWLFFFAATTLVVMPYCMPKMHDRYFLPAEVCLVALACCEERFLLPAALLECALLLPYLNFFRSHLDSISIDIAILASTAALFVMLRELLKTRVEREAATHALSE